MATYLFETMTAAQYRACDTLQILFEHQIPRAFGDDVILVSGGRDWVARNQPPRSPRRRP